MLFTKTLITLLAASFAPILAVATPNQPTTTSKAPVTTTVTITATSTATPVSQCNTGTIDCCNSVQSSNDPVVSTLLGLLGVVLSGVDIPVGVTCSPITVGAGGSSGCTAQTVCCENDSFNGVIALGCVPIDISL